MKMSFARNIGLLASGGVTLVGLSSCALPRFAELKGEESLSAANMAALAPEEESSITAVGAGAPEAVTTQLPEAILAAGPAYTGERSSPWDIPAEEFVNLVSRDEQTAGDEALLAGGDYLAYATSILAEKKEAVLSGSAEDTEAVVAIKAAEDGAEETEESVEVLPAVAVEAKPVLGEGEMELEEARRLVAEAGIVEKNGEEGVVTSQGSFTIAGAIEEKEFVETASLPRLPVKVSERFRTVKTVAVSREQGLSVDAEAPHNALGSDLQAGIVRSARADWSRFPVGTRFRVLGDASEQEYVVDDYLEADATGEVELIMPTEEESEVWGSREVVIEVLNQGSFDKSLTIMKASEVRMTEPHVQAMVVKIENRFAGMNKAERGIRPEGGLLGRKIAR